MDARRVHGVVGAADRLAVALGCDDPPAVGEEKVKGGKPIFLMSFTIDGVTMDVSFPVETSHLVVERINKMTGQLLVEAGSAGNGAGSEWRRPDDARDAVEG